MGGRGLTLSVFPDFSFRDEWSGLFYTDEKVLDYIAVKTERGWAAPENAVVEKTIVGKDAITFTHEINGHNVRIKIARRAVSYKGSELEQLVLSVDGSSENEVEVGVCGRHAYDQSCGQVEVVNNGIFAGRNVLTLFSENERPVVSDLGQRVHKQGEKEYLIRVIRAPFKDRIVIDVRHTPQRFSKAIPTANATFQSDSEEWNELYRRAKETLRILTKRRGWYAGLPWFVQYWGRDTFISVPALVREGYAPLVKRTLLDFLYSKVDGEIPRLIRENGVPEFGSIDTNPLFLNAVADYVTISGDYRFLTDNATDTQEAFVWILDEAEGFLPKSKGKDTWMDTLEIRKHPIEVAGYTLSAIRKLVSLGVLADSIYADTKRVWENNRDKFMLERSANVLLAAVYGLISPEKAVELAKEWRLISEWGIRSWSPLEAEYDPKGYHTGAVWGLTTAAGLYVALAAGDWETATVLRDALLRRARWTRYLDEVWDAKTGEPIGADAQLWSAALVIRAIDEIMINKRRIPPEITKIRRTRWHKGRMKHVSIG